MSGFDYAFVLGMIFGCCIATLFWLGRGSRFFLNKNKKYGK
jgi:hypothetical protein